MIVVRFKVQCQPEKTEQVNAALQEVIAPSRALDGVISFDIGRDLADPNSFIATERLVGAAFLVAPNRDRVARIPVVREALKAAAFAAAALLFHLRARPARRDEATTSR